MADAIILKDFIMYFGFGYIIVFLFGLIISLIVANGKKTKKGGIILIFSLSMLIILGFLVYSYYYPEKIISLFKIGG